MSEYIEIETEIDDDDLSLIYFYTNLPLISEEGGVERYDSAAEMAEGSALAQALAAVDGLVSLRLEGRDLTVRRVWEAVEHAVVADVSAVLKDFFL